eukprot:507170-Prorocentrum_minimum.AAC.1
MTDQSDVLSSPPSRQPPGRVSLFFLRSTHHTLCGSSIFEEPIRSAAAPPLPPGAPRASRSSRRPSSAARIAPPGTPPGTPPGSPPGTPPGTPPGSPPGTPPGTPQGSDSSSRRTRLGRRRSARTAYSPTPPAGEPRPPRGRPPPSSGEPPQTDSASAPPRGGAGSL